MSFNIDGSYIPGFLAKKQAFWSRAPAFVARLDTSLWAEKYPGVMLLLLRLTIQVCRGLFWQRETGLSAGEAIHFLVDDLKFRYLAIRGAAVRRYIVDTDDFMWFYRLGGHFAISPIDRSLWAAIDARSAPVLIRFGKICIPRAFLNL